NTAAHGHSDPNYWDRRAATYARSTGNRVDQFLAVVEPFVSHRKTLIDVGAGAGRHAVPLAEKLEWVTAVEPSEGMRAHLPALPNLTVVASAWEDAEVAPADLVICCHVLYGVAEVVPFVDKLERSDRDRVAEMTSDIWDGHDYIARVFDDWVADASSAFQAVEVDGVVVGLHRLRPYAPGLMWYEGLRVATSHQRQGIARAMLESAIAEARGQ